MFTGIVEELGTIVSLDTTADGARLTVAGPLVVSDASHGDSIAVNGVCLTVVETEGERFTVDVVGETLRRSGLGDLEPGARVNLERAMALGDRLGGHIVQGHVDGTGTLLGKDPDGTTRFAMPQRLARYLVEKGSITVDGVSLTVVAAGQEEFRVALIPTTEELTTLGNRSSGERVNLEVDAMAKYVERLVTPHLDHLDGSIRSPEGDNGGGREQAR